MGQLGLHIVRVQEVVDCDWRGFRTNVVALALAHILIIIEFPSVWSGMEQNGLHIVRV